MQTARRRNRLAAAATAAGVIAATVFTGAATAQASTKAMHHHGPDHIFYIMMENHGFSQVVGNTADAPFTTALANKYNLATNFHGVTHPSLPNYLAMFSGSNQGIWDDCAINTKCAPEEFVPNSGDATDQVLLTPAQVASASNQVHMFAGKNLVDQLEGKGLSWKAYMQSMPSAGFQGEYFPGVQNGVNIKLYAQKHNPFVYFSDIENNPNRLKKIVPFENNFADDLEDNKVPNFVWISPDQCHDMHGMSPAAAAAVKLPTCGYPASGLDHGAIKLGDDYLKQTVSEIMSSKTWKTSDSQIVISWDENDYSGNAGGPGSPVGVDGKVLGGGDAPLIVINSDPGKRKVEDDLTDHYSVLAAIQQEWHLGCLGATCDDAVADSSLRDLFRK